MIIKVSGYSVVKDKIDASKIKWIVVHGMNLEKKASNLVGYECLFTKRSDKTIPGLWVSGKYSPIFTPDIVSKNLRIDFDMNGYITNLEVVK